MAESNPKPMAHFELPERFSEPTPIAPDEATWRALTPAQREAKVWELIDALPLTEVMSEGTPHSDAKMTVVSSLRRFFGQRRRGLFIAPELMVAYPGEPTFVPDVLAVRDVELRHRTSWMVVDEGRGPDFILEIRNKGSRAKDYRRNVERFARHGIPEYFVYDVIRQELAGHRLDPRPEGASSPAQRRYVPIIPQGGRFHSDVLELDLVVLDGRLRFFYSGAEVPDVDAEVTMLTRMVEESSARLEASERLAAAEAERAAAEAERAAAEAERADAALAALRTALRGVLAARGLTPSAATLARIEATTDAAHLAALLPRAATLPDADALFDV
jgi:Uma2 family endonuclease